MQLTTITDETRLVFANFGDRATGLVTPTVRLGVTGLARAGKTVFITALVHNLVHGGRLPLFKAYAGGPRRRAPAGAAARRRRAALRLRATTCGRWSTSASGPRSTRRISELRLTIGYELRALPDADDRTRASSTSTSSTIPASGCSTCRC